MKPVRVRCNCCKGSGAVELSGVYMDTIAALEKSGETWAAKLADALDCKPTAASQRLAYMESIGVVTSRRAGKRRLYKVADFNAT